MPLSAPELPLMREDLHQHRLVVGGTIHLDFSATTKDQPSRRKPPAHRPLNAIQDQPLNTALLLRIAPVWRHDSNLQRPLPRAGLIRRTQSCRDAARAVP